VGVGEKRGGLEERRFDVVVNCTGRLNNWKLPDVRGLEDFRRVTYSANWDESW
jgi:cation diffusion facilitator CzcD-associated flavoprotein CzcO